MSANLHETVYEKILLIEIVGVLEALTLGKISIDESEKFLFSPHMVKLLRRNRCNKKIINILERGCELEDIASLIPQYLLETISELKLDALEELGKYPEFYEKFWPNVIDGTMADSNKQG